MKHTITVTIVMLSIFFLAQVIGLGVVNSYIDHDVLKATGELTYEDLPLNFERPEVDEGTSFIYIILAVLLGTVLALILIRFNQHNLWKLWFLIAVFLTLAISFKAFIPASTAIGLAGVLALWKIYKPNFYVHNLTELFIYGGLAAIFVPILNLFSITILLLFISAYDAYAVFKSKHMIKLAKFQTKTVFAGAMVPYVLPSLTKKKGKTKKVKTKVAILGGGDIGFPLLFAGVILKELVMNTTSTMAYLQTLIVPVFVTAALAWLFIKADKNKFYPAMPVVSAGCFAALLVMKITGIL